MANLLKLSKKERRAERMMQKLLFGEYLKKPKNCTKKSQKMEVGLLNVIYSTN